RWLALIRITLGHKSHQFVQCPSAAPRCRILEILGGVLGIPMIGDGCLMPSLAVVVIMKNIEEWQEAGRVPSARSIGILPVWLAGETPVAVPADPSGEALVPGDSLSQSPHLGRVEFSLLNIVNDLPKLPDGLLNAVLVELNWHHGIPFG